MNLTTAYHFKGKPMTSNEFTILLATHQFQNVQGVREYFGQNEKVILLYIASKTTRNRSVSLTGAELSLSLGLNQNTAYKACQKLRANGFITATSEQGSTATVYRSVQLSRTLYNRDGDVILDMSPAPVYQYDKFSLANMGFE